MYLHIEIENENENENERQTGNMSFNNRKFSMNRSTGSPRISTKIARRFSTLEPSQNGMLIALSWSLFLITSARLSLRTLEDYLNAANPPDSCGNA
jgi:hypothetical protein